MAVTEMPRAVLITGDDAQSMAGGIGFGNALLSRFGVDTRFIDCAEVDSRYLHRELTQLLRAGTAQPLIIAYNGHGGTNGWAPWPAKSYRHRIAYRELARLARKYSGPLLFVNSSCFAETMSDEFQRQGLPADRIGVIAACEGSWMSVGTLLLCQVMDAWFRKKPYVPGYMGEMYFVPDTKAPDGLRQEFFATGHAFGLEGRLRWSLRRPVFALRSLLRPLEHSTYFSRRWGAQWDSLVFQHLRPEPRVSAEELFLAYATRLLPELHAAVDKFYLR